METQSTEVIFILDRSGSMSGLESDTIGGYNGFLQRQQEDPGETRITTVLFDDQYELLHDSIPVKTVTRLTEKEYFTRGSTAFLDAIGRTITTVAQRLDDQADLHPSVKVIMVITTDGYENSSREYNLRQVQALIKAKMETHQWEFIFLGADIAAEDIADTLGIARDRAVRYKKSSVGTQDMFYHMADNISEFKMTGKMKKSWKDGL